MPRRKIKILKPLRHLTIKQAILISIPLLTIVGWVVLLLILHGQYTAANIEHYIESQGRMVAAFVHANTTSFRLHDYPEVSRNMAMLDFGPGGALAGILDKDGEYIVSEGKDTERFFRLMNEWGKTNDLKQKFRGTRFALGGDSYFVFQVPIKGDQGDIGTFVSFVSDAMFRQQERLFRQRLLIVGSLLLLIQMIIIYLVSNAIVAPVEVFVKKWLHGEDASQIHEQLVADDHPYTKDILQLSKAIAKMLARQETDVAVGRLSFQIAHDIRSPLSTIQNFIKVDQAELDEGDRKLLQDSALRCARRLNDMADDLLSYSKSDGIERRKVELSKMVRDIMTDFKSIVNGKVNLVYDGADPLFAYADVRKFERVLVNLVKNAVEAIEDHGTITISAGVRGDKNIYVVVKDDGKGISPEHVPLIFNSSFTHGKKGGTGLGLAYCEKIIKAHGGVISVKSELGRGTEFDIVIPYSHSS